MRALGPALLAVSMSGLAGCDVGPPRAQAPPRESAPVTIDAHGPALSPAHRRDPYVGVIIAREAIDLSAEFSGTLSGAQLPIGTHVEAGAILARVEVATLEADLEAAEASLHARYAILAQRQLGSLDARRQDLVEATLLDAGASPERERERARLELELARAGQRKAAAEVREGRAALAGLRAKRDSGELVAPFAGKISSWYQRGGELVLAGDPVVRLTAVERPWVRFAVLANDLGEVAPGDPIEITLLPRGERVSGIVRHLAPELDLASQMLIVEAELEPSETSEPGDSAERQPALMIGQGCHVRILAPAPRAAP